MLMNYVWYKRWSRRQWAGSGPNMKKVNEENMFLLPTQQNFLLSYKGYGHSSEKKHDVHIWIKWSSMYNKLHIYRQNLSSVLLLVNILGRLISVWKKYNVQNIYFLKMVLTIQSWSICKAHKVFFSFSSQHRLKTCDRHHSIIDDTFAAVVLKTTVRIICFNNDIIKILCNSLTGYQPCGFYQIKFKFSAVWENRTSL